MKLVILRTGDVIAEVAARRGEFAAWIRAGIGAAWSGDWIEVDMRGGETLPRAHEASGFIITGSVSSVTERAPWMLRAEDYVRGLIAAKAPLLGICFGHQLIAQAMGGTVGRNPRGREIGTTDLRICMDDPLFAGLSGSFAVNSSHVDSVVMLPPGARVLATTLLEPVTAFALGESTRGVQFHPEMDGDAVRHYIRVRADRMKTEGLDPDAHHAVAVDAPRAVEIMRNFVRGFVMKRAVAAA